jgi:glucosamine kinase
VEDETYRLGIDGGGTGCRARLTDAQGRVLGDGEGGPANLTLGPSVALDSIMQATREALAKAGLGEPALAATHAGLGLAAANVPQHMKAFQQLTLPFQSAVIRSDAEVACLGAHRGDDGAILILGTGSQGVLHQRGSFTTVGGWGFALSDSGSGAILGRAAVRRSFLAHEGVEPASPFTATVLARFGNDRTTMLEWASNARPREWGEFARVVFDHAEQGDAVAIELVRASAFAAERMLDRLIAMGARRIALMGGVAQPTKRHLAPRFTPFLVEPMGDALDGALLLARTAVPVRAPRFTPSPRATKGPLRGPGRGLG